MATLRTRIAALESARRTRIEGRYGVVRCRPGESVEDAAERGYTDGYTACLVVPEISEVAVWLDHIAVDTREREQRNYEIVGEFLARERRQEPWPPKFGEEQ